MCVMVCVCVCVCVSVCEETQGGFNDRYWNLGLSPAVQYPTPHTHAY